MARQEPLSAEVDAQALEAEFDPEMNFRQLPTSFAAVTVGAALALLSLFHYYTAGFGLLVDHWHLGIHLATVMALIFLVFGASRKAHGALPGSGLLTPAGLPLYDWVLAGLAVATVLYIPFEFHDLAFRVGAPITADVIMGSILILLILEATRRCMGPTLPLIVIIFILYGLFGQQAPGPLAHPGADWDDLVNHLYLTSQGIFGVPVHVVATFVFHFVLFGVVATRIGLGRFFLDIAYAIAGRYSGGPAKVSVLSSAMFGMISGSSIANTVTTGALTIPAMKKNGYKPHFAAAVEATASTGGQITPPLMGAAAFVMAEFLEVSYQTIIIAAIIPAFMHFLGVLTMVHLEAKSLGLKGVAREHLPQAAEVMKRDWPMLIPLIVLIGVILSGRTPYSAAFFGITAAIVVGFLNPKNRLTLADLYDAFKLGAKYALGVGAAAASVGIIVGVVTLSGMGFRLSYIVVNFAGEIGTFLSAFVPFGLLEASDIALFFTLVLTAFSSIVLGAGIPTTACYIILAAIAAPALGLLGVEPIVAHFFVFYFGVLADVTPPVAVAAYAGAAIANANAFKAGNTAFRLASAKALAPFVFVYAPSMLIMVQDFSLAELVIATIGCAAGVFLLGIGFSGWFLGPMRLWERACVFCAALLLVAPGLQTAVAGLAVTSPWLLKLWRNRSRKALHSEPD